MIISSHSLLAALVLAAAPLQASAQDTGDLPTSLKAASSSQVAEALPAPARSAILGARDRKHYVAATVEFARAAAGKDGILTEADAKGFAKDDPRAIQIRYYLKTPYLKSYSTPRKLGSRSVPRISVRRMGKIAGATWDKFDVNHDGVLSTEERAPLRLARGESTSSRLPDSKMARL